MIHNDQEKFRIDESDFSSQQYLMKMRIEKDRDAMAKQQKELEEIGEYNAYSRPRASKTIPLRSCFFDPEINNIPPSKTQSELKKKIKLSSIPHPSYDLDCDGFVSSDDYKFAKRFDLDGNGVLDPRERKVCKKLLAHEFFQAHTDDISNFGEQYALNSHKQNVEKLSNALDFEQSYKTLRKKERSILANSTKQVLDCMQVPDDTLTRHNVCI